MHVSLQAARGGDRNAVEAVVSHLHRRVATMARHYGRLTGEDPADLGQEAWLGVLEGIAQVDCSIGSPLQYLIHRARWRLLDAVKRARIRRCLRLDEDFVSHTSAAALSAFEDGAQVDRFRDTLAPTQREVLDSILQGCTFRETGAALGCTSANVAYHMRVIRRRYDDWASGV